MERIRQDLHESDGYQTHCQQYESSRNKNYFQKNGGSVSLPQHSYWFDFCLFILFNIAFFLVIYFFVP
uniref:Transmembrane protein n=1 Tax=Paramormyrops kingsleyae TaxID=1676925 RepID=A0A3B3RLV6_9TELE